MNASVSPLRGSDSSPRWRRRILGDDSNSRRQASFDGRRGGGDPHGVTHAAAGEGPAGRISYPVQAALVPSLQPGPTGIRGHLARSVVLVSVLPGSCRMRRAITYAFGLGCVGVAVMA